MTVRIKELKKKWLANYWNVTNSQQMVSETR